MEAARAGGRFVVCNGLVCCVRGGDEVAIVIPDDSELRTELLTKHHDLPLAGHLGLYRMTKALSKRYYWKTCTVIVELTFVGVIYVRV